MAGQQPLPASGLPEAAIFDESTAGSCRIVFLLRMFNST